MARWVAGVEVLILLAAGIISDELAEDLDLPRGLTVALGVALIGLLFLMQVRRLPRPAPAAPAVRQPIIRRALTRSVVTLRAVLVGVSTALPFGLLVGAAGAAVFIWLMPARAPLVIYGREGGPWNYEIIGYGLGVLLTYGIASRNRPALVLFSFALGYATGFAAAVLGIRPEENSFGFTFLSWNLLMVVAASILRSKIAQDLRVLVGEVIKRLIGREAAN